jgi:hypothetical protein
MLQFSFGNITVIIHNLQCNKPVSFDKKFETYCGNGLINQLYELQLPECPLLSFNFAIKVEE